MIADDLTGALDTGVQFTRLGLDTYVALEWSTLFHALKALRPEGSPAPDPIVAVVNSGTRTMGNRHEVIRQTLLALWALENSEKLFVKIDSTLRGPWRDALEGIPPSRAKQMVVCPAFPALGRVVKSGGVYLHGRRVGEIRTPDRQASANWEVPNAETDDDLDCIVDEHWDQSSVLFCGSAGLAAALARRLFAETPTSRLISPVPWQPASRPAVVVGSRTELARAQVARLRESDLAHQLFLAIPANDGPDDLAFADELARQLAEEQVRTPFGGLVICGGETADRVLSRLGVRTVELAAELLPGCPLGVLRGGTADGARVVTKSGSFGERDTLVRLVRLLQGGSA